MAPCVRCGEPIPAGARYCAACGAETARPVHDGREVRKTVTILFCDVVGSTSLGEATDPETTRRVMSRYAEGMTTVVGEHGGVVERFRGDEVMAVFGLPVAHEDDALRAVRAGSEMLRRLAALNAELRASWGVELTCRIGINTGEVIAGDPGSGETFVTGDAVNLAKRLEQGAQPGGILIGATTYALVRDAVTVGPAELFEAKGKREPVSRHALIEVDPTAAGFTRRLDVPLVDRANELATIRSQVERRFAEGRGGIVSLIGAAGIGKSRLAREVAAAFEPRAQVTSGRCLAYGSGITYWPLVEVIDGLGGLAAVSQEIADLDDAEAILERVGTVMGSEELAAPSDELFWGVRKLLEGVARERPLLLCLEDLQWAESTMLDLIEYLAAFATGPVVMLCNARPDLLEVRPAWSTYPLVELDPLSPEETDELITSLGIADVTDRRRIASTAEGNPLFAEHLVAMVAGSDDQPGAVTELPASIHALLTARLDSLDPGERRVLERASIVGTEFWQRAVADLASPDDRPYVAGRLLSLARKGLVGPIRSDLRGEDVFKFRHALIREVAYAGIPKSVRADLHARFSTRLQGQTSKGFADDEIAGYHAEHAYRYRIELGPADDDARALAEQAAALLGAAGRRAFLRDDMPAAAGFLGRAAALLPEQDPRRLEALCDQALALWEAGRAEEGAAALLLLRAEATAAGHERLVALAELEQVVHEQLAGVDVGAVQSAAERVIAFGSEVGDDVSVARAWRRLSAAHRRAGAYSAGEEAARHALTHARAAANRQEEARAADALCNCLLYGPTSASEALTTCHELLSAPGRTRTLEASVMGVAAGLEAMLGEFDTARQTYRRASAILEELGLELARAALTQIGVPIALLAGNASEAEREATKGAEILLRIESASLQAPLVAEALLAQGRIREASTVLADTASEPLPAIVQWHVHRGIVETRLAIARTRFGEAVEAAESAVRLARETDDPTLQGDALAAYAEALLRTDRLHEAAAAVETARALYVAKGNVASAEALPAAVGSGS